MRSQQGPEGERRWHGLKSQQRKSASPPARVRCVSTPWRSSCISGPITEKFAKKNPVVSRTIQMRGDQTLEDLHHAIFDAFGRGEEHMYEFQFGKGPMDPKAPRYVLPSAFEIESGEDNPPTGRVDRPPSSRWA